MNPNWIRTTIASVLLAIVLKVGLHVPFFTTFITVAIIYLMNVVLTEMGTGATTAWTWTKDAGNIAMGVVIFLALRFLAARVLGLYPIDTYDAIGNSGGLYGIFPGHDISKVILWEVTFAMVAGQITVMWVKETHKLPVRGIIVFSLAILSLQIAFPKYVNSWPNREVVSTNLVNNGVVGTTAKGAWVFLFGKSTPSPPPVATATVLVPATPVPSAVPAEKPWTFRTLEIPPEGLPVYLYPGFRGWPKGGPITITTPSGQVLRDQPGVVNHFGYQPEGWYTYKADPVGSARQIQIYNRW